MPTNGHGGLCCGIKNIYNLDEYTTEELKSQTEDLALGDHRRRTRRCMLVEVACAGGQIQEWHDSLVEIGYVPVSEFYNVNTGRKIRIYHYFIPTPDWQARMPKVQ